MSSCIFQRRDTDEWTDPNCHEYELANTLVKHQALHKMREKEEDRHIGTEDTIMGKDVGMYNGQITVFHNFQILEA